MHIEENDDYMHCQYRGIFESMFGMSGVMSFMSLLVFEWGFQAADASMMSIHWLWRVLLYEVKYDLECLDQKPKSRGPVG